ncbi:hypothetical protein [Lysinibacillus fusiformis]|uniref:hypothetical protein n=1 Tax=Lysinibacillus fusiformis TaxID=28031 RepID=UPI000507E25A|nr:hypothetical protein [Lysinibacillus fusiformis]KGA83949.1 hypothetical protein KQ41_03885 [Lysinibacillus fusiformis]UXJ70845.1 hypothetical protein N5069_09990 [Lysinibacillus fusiformis]
MSVIFTYTKYILMILSAIQLTRFSPEYLEPILLYEYLILIAFCFFLGLLEDFLKPSKKTNILVRLAITIGTLVLLFTSVSLKSTATIIFSIIMFSAFSFSVFLEIKQKD